MSRVAFHWDPIKAAANWRKHGVTFHEAVTAFDDESALLEDDPVHSVAEERWIQLGRSAGGRLLVVVYAYHEAADVIRIISARAATSGERSIYDSRSSS